MKTLTSGCENVPAWCTWMTYPICWGHSWWSYPYLLVLYGIRLTQEPACRHLFISWPCSIEKSRFFSFKQPDIQMSTDKLGLFNSVWPSDAFNLPWDNLIRLCIHDKKPSFMTSQVCVCVCWRFLQVWRVGCWRTSAVGKSKPLWLLIAAIWSSGTLHYFDIQAMLVERSCSERSWVLYDK